MGLIFGDSAVLKPLDPAMPLMTGIATAGTESNGACPQKEPHMDLGALLTGTNPLFVDVALLVGRVAIGVCFMIHAFGKLGLVGTGNMSGYIEWLESMGIPFAPVQAYMAMLTELLGGFALAVGFMTRPACLLLGFTMIVAARLGHKGAGYLITNEPEGAEYTINLAAICAVLFLIGPGTFSVDAILF